MASGFVVADREQQFLMPPDVREWLPEDHLAWCVIEAVDQIDLSAFYAARRADGWGRPAFDPKMMVALLLYSYAIGVRSSREIERRLLHDVAYRVIAGNHQPDHATIARFRQTHEHAISDLFSEVLRLCARAGMVRVGVVALDGTKIAADAGSAQNRDATWIEAEVDRMLAEATAVDAREDELYGDRRGDEMPASLSRRSERIERLRRAKAELDGRAASDQKAYDDKIAARAAAEAAGKKVPGRRPKPPEERTNTAAKTINVTDPDARTMRDGGRFMTGYNAQVVATENHVVIAHSLSQVADDKVQFMPMLEQTKANLVDAGVTSRIGTVVADAGYLTRTNCKPPIPHPPEVFIAVPPLRPGGVVKKRGVVVLEMEAKIQTDRGRELIRRRSQINEPIFGDIKGNRGMRRFMRRGFDACASEWSLIATAHNLKKLWRWPSIAPVSPVAVFP